MFVNRIDIEEFRGIKGYERPIDLAQFTVLVGRNNSGKSTVLEALSLLPLPRVYKVEGYDRSREEILMDLHSGRLSLLYGYSEKATINYTIGDHESKVIIRDDKPTNLFVDENMISCNQRGLEKISSFLNVKPDSKLVNRTVFFIPNDTSYLQKINEALADPAYRNLVIKSGAHIRVAKEIINECVTDDYTGVFFRPELCVRKELTDNVFYLDVRDLGAGIEKTIIHALWLEAINPKLVLWDDFEVTAHPTLVKYLLSWPFQEKNGK